MRILWSPGSSCGRSRPDPDSREDQPDRSLWHRLHGAMLRRAAGSELGGGYRVYRRDARGCSRARERRPEQVRRKDIQPDHPFFAGQRRIILTNSGKADPERRAEYVSTGGYQSLLRATEMTPSEIIAEVKKS